MEIAKEDKADIVEKIKDYFSTELDQDIGQFDAEFLLEFFIKEIGPFFYNQGLFDARAAMQKVVDDVDERLLALELPTQ
ncbi:MAG: DUF2164 domain-containing protein [Pyrinomonadaceae bacterium]